MFSLKESNKTSKRKRTPKPILFASTNSNESGFMGLAKNTKKRKHKNTSIFNLKNK